jgi:hypothetical protein
MICQDDASGGWRCRVCLTSVALASWRDTLMQSSPEMTVAPPLDQLLRGVTRLVRRVRLLQLNLERVLGGQPLFRTLVGRLAGWATVPLPIRTGDTPVPPGTRRPVTSPGEEIRGRLWRKGVAITCALHPVLCLQIRNFMPPAAGAPIDGHDIRDFGRWRVKHVATRDIHPHQFDIAAALAMRARGNSGVHRSPPIR